jgi:hypothetical protein
VFFEDGLDFREIVEPLDQESAFLAILEQLIKHGANVEGEARDFSVTSHGFSWLGLGFEGSGAPGKGAGAPGPEERPETKGAARWRIMRLLYHTFMGNHEITKFRRKGQGGMKRS